MDFHVITPRGVELVAQVVDGKLVIVPPECQLSANMATETRMDAQIPQVRFPPPPPSILRKPLIRQRLFLFHRLN